MVAPARQLSDANVGGTGLGQSASDLISLYGVTPVAQAAFVASCGSKGAVTIQAISTSSGFTFTSSSAGTQLFAVVEAMRVALINVGILASS